MTTVLHRSLHQKTWGAAIMVIPAQLGSYIGAMSSASVHHGTIVPSVLLAVDNGRATNPCAHHVKLGCKLLDRKSLRLLVAGDLVLCSAWLPAHTASISFKSSCSG